jgi:putative copper export protein
VLTIKLFLVMIAIGLGAINRFRVLPQIVGGSRLKQDHDESAALRRFVRILTTESLVLLVAIIAAAVLSCVAPAVSA